MSTAALPVSVALVSESAKVPFSALAPVAAALQQQVQRDFAPVWHVSAVVTPFADEQHVPPGYWKILIKDDIGDPQALGYHTDDHRQPISYVVADKGWATTCSHELLEMLADPWGNRLWVAKSPDGSGQRVHVLVEVADPCEAVTYEIGNVAVTDFAFPAFYHTVRRGENHNYCVTGALKEPRKILPGGYISYVGDDGVWWQQTWWGQQPATQRLGSIKEFAEPHESLRQAIDRVSRLAKVSER